MSYVIKVVTQHGREFDEKSTLLEKQGGLSVSDQRRIVNKMIAIIKQKGRKDNWQTGLEAEHPTLRDQYWDWIKTGDITEEEFKFFKSLVPTGLFGTSTITEVIHAEVADWYNRLND
jgi:hypothetical protein